MSLAAVAARVGVSKRSVAYALSRSRASSPTAAPVRAEPSGELVPLAKPEARDVERQAARRGEMTEAPPVITEGASLPLAGALVILPTLAATGLLDAFEQTYGSVGPAFYGLGSLVLSMSFAALLGCSRAEAAGRLSPTDVGRLIGLDRGPEPATVRRRSEELAALRRSDQLGLALARHRLDSLQAEEGGLFSWTAMCVPTTARPGSRCTMWPAWAGRCRAKRTPGCATPPEAGCWCGRRLPARG